ncbi:hypothetical protein [Thermomonas sp. XSG]|uniref:hypothetical protein n=1 Tax=Thermomonas sp. XSG TaxID=2771436 RepID=UPI00086BD5B2|nr:hypothetical protein [Thermomonas sp. XSG]ODU52155.1 MAG: hypothetical protein ABS98_04740 [Xanthomonadaceae bacterium SCN 69-48]QNU15146.1 hypothetical protein ICG51_001483 [Thermomonas sp. XSG]
MSVTFIPVWKQVTPALAGELAAFWREHRAIGNQAEAELRAQQVVCIARDEAGALCGVGTAIVKVLPRLRQPTYYYRQFFARSLRGRQQELAFFQRCKQLLQDYNSDLPQPESLGMLLEIENAKIASAYRRAVEPGFDAVFIGYSPRGLPLRVSYFANACLLSPAPIQGRRAGRVAVASS